MTKKRAKKRKLELAVAYIQRRFGPRSLVKGRLPEEATAPSTIPHIPTGFPALDQALGVGGLPQGKISEITGPATSGKTTLALKLLAQAQANDGQVGYIDQARYFDPDYAHRCGLDLSRLLVGAPYDWQETLAMTESLVRSGSLTAMVVDILDLFWSDPEAAQHLAVLLNRLAAPLARAGTLLLFLHEAGTPSPALSALAHYASVRLQLARGRWIERHGDVRGYEAQVRILKNRMGPAGRAVTIAIQFNGTVRGNGL